MKTEITLTNETFNFLKSSNGFLNIVLNNINGCVLLLDKQMKLKAFNNALKTIFSNKKDEDLLYMRCGEAIGCAYQIEEQKDCGETSRCNVCELRISALTSYMNNEEIFKSQISRPFFDANNQKVEKHLQFSTRVFNFNNEKYIIMIIEDISKFVELEKKLTNILLKS
jgi:nitrogen fixation/metabolism regulation signal transduction histidine kinase